MGLLNLKGKKPIWKWNKSHSKLTRGDGKGVDWYCYAIYIEAKAYSFYLSLYERLS